MPRQDSLSLNSLKSLRIVEVPITSQQMLWLLEEFGEEVNAPEAIARLINRTMAAQYRVRLKQANEGVTVVQLPVKSQNYHSASTCFSRGALNGGSQSCSWF